METCYIYQGLQCNDTILTHNKFHSSLADEGLIKPVLAKVLPFTAESLEEGFTLLKSRRAVGKIVFDMNT